MSEATGVRHIYTAIEKKPGQESGFGTVAYSKQLEELVPEIQHLVEGFSAPEGNEPPCRQLLKVPKTPAYALTTFTAMGPLPDKRPGNYWAETIVVPEAWLKSAEWDTAAAFEVLEWLEPRAASNPPEELDPFALPDLVPGPLDRLATLNESVPADLLLPLLRAVAQQSMGLRPLRILGTSETAHETLEKVVMCLPFLVHPSLRTYREGSERRCLTFRTLSPLGTMAPAADLTGFPVTAADRLAMEGSDVIDLGGQIPAPSVRDRGGDAYVFWLKQVIRQERWAELEAQYREPASGRPEAWFASFRRSQLPAPAPPADPGPKDFPPQAHSPEPEAPAEPTEAAPAEAAATGAASVGAAREQRAEARAGSRMLHEEAWGLRDEAEGSAWNLLKDHQRRFQERLDDYQTSMEKAIKEAKETLDSVVKGQAAEIGDQARKVSTTARAHQNTLESVFSQRLDELESRLGGLGQQVDQLRRQPAAFAGTAVGRAETKRERKISASLMHRIRSGNWLRWIKDRLWGLRPTRKGKSTEWQIAPIAVLLLVISSYLVYQFQAEREESETGPVDPPEETIAEPSPAEAREIRRQKLVEELRKTEVAFALLAKVKDSGNYAEHADRLALMITLGQIEFTQAGEIALLQEVLGATADGGWGGSSRSILKSNLATCGKCLPEESRDAPGNDLLKWNSTVAHCVLRGYLELSTEDCGEVSPWRAGRSWTEEEAGRALDLIRATASVVNTELKKQLSTFDGVAGSAIEGAFERVQRLSPEHAESFLDLAYSWAIQKPDERLPENPTDRQFEKLEALLVSMKDDEGNS